VTRRRGIAITLAGAALVAGGGRPARADAENPFACKTASGAIPAELHPFLQTRGVAVVGTDGDVHAQIDAKLTVVRAPPPDEKLMKSASWQASVHLYNASGSYADAGAFRRDLLPHFGAIYTNPVPWEAFYRERLAPALDDFDAGVAIRADRPGARIVIDGIDRDLPTDPPLYVRCRKRGSMVLARVTSGGVEKSVSLPVGEAGEPTVIEVPSPPPAAPAPLPVGPPARGGAGSGPYLGAAAAAAILALALYARSRRRAPAPATPAPPAARPLRILVLASSPADTAPLDLEKELDAIRQRIGEGLDHAGRKIELFGQLSVTFDDVLRTLNQVRPDIVHLSAHGTRSGEIHLADDEGLSNAVSERTLERLFTVLKDEIRVVVLNACYSERQARAIARVIDCTIGMKRAVRDDVAATFSASFYRAIACGRDVQNAFDQGCLAIAGMPRPTGPAADRDIAPPSVNAAAGPPPSTPLPPDEVPALHVRSGVSASDIVLVAAPAPR
jgi:hypothetical protein